MKSMLTIRTHADYQAANEKLATLEYLWTWTKDADTFNQMMRLAEHVDAYERANTQPLTFTRHQVSH